ncbi:kinase-like domain [Cordyceps militaris]|uniref:Kinase-like domain n=1 Tax=Cordyceps militaris TaxID=73501 RepID=A0A2H4S631_CORMI|nr:kinase-like domain [Cordyceps militaris]
MDRLLAYLWTPFQRAVAEADSSDADEIIGQSRLSKHLAPGTVLIHESPMRRVVLEPNNTVVKAGRHLVLAEADAIKVASDAGLPVPRLHSVSTNEHRVVEIRMDYIPGQSLDKLWPTMSADEKKSVASQLREIIEQMRAMEPPPNYIGCCGGTGIRETTVHSRDEGPVCKDETEFNNYLVSSLFKQIPTVLRTSFRNHLRTDHRIVFSHGDLTPRNIMMQDGKISGVVDWEDAGWYPEYWELIKFIERPAVGDWKEYAEVIFSTLYPTELVTYVGMSKWRF